MSQTRILKKIKSANQLESFLAQGITNTALLDFLDFNTLNTIKSVSNFFNIASTSEMNRRIIKHLKLFLYDAKIMGKVYSVAIIPRIYWNGFTVEERETNATRSFPNASELESLFKSSSNISFIIQKILDRIATPINLFLLDLNDYVRNDSNKISNYSESISSLNKIPLIFNNTIFKNVTKTRWKSLKARINSELLELLKSKESAIKNKREIILLLKAGADLKVKGNPSHSYIKMTAQEMIIYHNLPMLLKTLVHNKFIELNEKMNLHTKKCESRTLLMTAASYNKPNMITALLELGAEINATFQNKNALAFTVNEALFQEDKIKGLECFKLLVEKGIYLNLDDNSNNVLYLSVESRNVRITEYIVKNFIPKLQPVLRRRVLNKSLEIAIEAENADFEEQDLEDVFTIVQTLLNATDSLYNFGALIQLARETKAQKFDAAGDLSPAEGNEEDIPDLIEEAQERAEERTNLVWDIYNKIIAEFHKTEKRILNHSKLIKKSRSAPDLGPFNTSELLIKRPGSR